MCVEIRVNAFAMKRSGRPRVLHLFNTMGQGGMERQMLQLVQLLRESGRYEVAVATQKGDGPLTAEMMELGIREVPAFPLKRLYGIGALRQLRRFAAHLRSLQVDVLHTHDFYTTTFGMAAAVLARVPVRIAARRELNVFTPLQRKLEHLAYRAADVIVANCERLRREVIREGIKQERVVTIPNAVDLRRVAAPADIDREAIATALGIPAGRRLVTMTAHLYNREKDFDALIAAAAAVIRHFPDVLFVCAGEGGPDDRGRIESLAAEVGVRKEILLPGRCNRIGELLAISEVGVLSSRSEGLSNSVLEYMAAGLPVVATDVGGIGEAVLEGETGYLVPPGDPEALAERIVSLLIDPARARRLGEMGRERASRSFSPGALLSRTAALYERLLAESGASRRW